MYSSNIYPYYLIGIFNSYLHNGHINYYSSFLHLSSNYSKHGTHIYPEHLKQALVLIKLSSKHITHDILDPYYNNLLKNNLKLIGVSSVL